MKLIHIVCSILLTAVVLQAQVTSPKVLRAVATVDDTVSFDILSNTPTIIKSIHANLSKKEEVLSPDMRRVSFFLNDKSQVGIFEALLVTQSTATSASQIRFVLDYRKSIVRANDDFVLMTGSEATIDPLVNDYANLNSSKKLSNISHLMHGTAVIEGSTIKYTMPDEVDRDYLVYSVQDSLGTYDVGTVYFVRKPDNLEPYAQEKLFVNSGDSVHIILEDSGFVANNPNLVHGELTQPASFVYNYKGAAKGIDTLEFVKGTVRRIFHIEVVEKRTSSRELVRHDRVFTAKKNKVTFDVFENDLSSDLSIVAHSQYIDHLGAGRFTYTPKEGEEGLKLFWYKASDGTKAEIAYVQMVISDFEPENSSKYHFTTAQESSVVIDYDVPINTYRFNVENEPWYGRIKVYGGEDEYLGACDTVYGKKMLIYTPLPGFVGKDQFEISYCASDSSDCHVVKVEVQVRMRDNNNCDCIEDCVWAGDANNDGVVNARDILTVGRYIGAQGPVRELSTIWKGEKAKDFGVTTALGKDVKYADTNGDGHIDYKDFLAVNDHMGKYHTLQSKINIDGVYYPFYFTTTRQRVEGGMEYILDFYLGNDARPIVDIEGISFDLNFNSNRIDSSSAQLTVSDNGFFLKNSPYFAEMFQPSKGKIGVSIIKTNGRASHGYGHLATFNTIIEEEVIGVRDPKEHFMNIVVDNVSVTDSDGHHFSMEGWTERVPLKPTSSTNLEDNPVQVYPNPASTVLRIENMQDLNSVEIFDLVGNRVMGATSQEIDVTRLLPGAYFLLIISDTEVVTKKVNIIR